MTHGLSTGVVGIDDLLDGVRVGDNLVMSLRGGASATGLVSRFVEARAGRRLVVCSDRSGWEPTATTVVDWSVADGVEDVRREIAAADADVGNDALFVFDDLTAVQSAWGPEAALRLFLWACPRLYRRRSVALWVLDADQHQSSFMRRLTEVTQVVVELSPGDAEIEATVVKADGRPSSTVGRRVLLTPDDLEVVEQHHARSAPLGDLIRRERTERQLAQVEVARRVGISPSALSQLERGVRSVSADTITRIWEVLGVPFGPDRGRPEGHRITRRSSQPPPDRAGGLTRRRLASAPDTGELWHVTIEAGASGRNAPFAVKSAEVVTVTRGVADLEVGGHASTLHEGDTLSTTTAAVTGWANPGADDCELFWVVLPHATRTA